MKLFNRTIVILIILFLLLGVLGELLFYLNISLFGNTTQTATAIGRIGGIILLLREGTLIKTKPFLVLVLLSHIPTLIGAMMKIMHWPFANLILFIGLISAPVFYFLHFLKKPNKHLLDMLKMLWVVVCYIKVISLIRHLPLGRELALMEAILLLAIFTYFTYMKPDRSY